MAQRQRKASPIDLDAHVLKGLLRGSALDGIRADSLAALFEHHQVIEVPPGASLYHEDGQPRLTLLVEGMVRVWIASSDGREITIRHARKGELVGVPTILIGPAAVRVSALTACRICYFQADTVRDLAGSDVAIALALARECAYNMFDLIERMQMQAFGSVRQRLAHHLLDLAVDYGGERVAVATAQELASAIGSARETVARTLAAMRREQLIRMRNGTIVLVDLFKLRDLVSTG